ncbi:MAG: tRNA preQ1(34) S-adenosylmethionine ribosyltransferase-isomerase QueA [Spirochaetota bacterium]
MRTRDFSFEVPPELIAQHPPTRRGDSRLLVLDVPEGTVHHSHVHQLSDYLPEGSLLVFNNTRVIPARIKAVRRDSGGVVEFLLLERTGDRRWRSIVGKSKRQRPGVVYDFPEGVSATVVAAEGEERIIDFSEKVNEDYLDRHGAVPLPPYVRRTPEDEDRTRYQTVYAEEPGSAAAPTAGLHFTDEMLNELARRGFELRFLTLHVGLGTFAPVRSEEVEDHEMHREHFTISRETAEAVNRARREDRCVVSVGTTTTRALESAWHAGSVRPGAASTNLFIYPGYRFRVVDRLFTNFHTPGSSLVMMVSALAGRERLLNAYHEAIRERYRFFSYGDAMLIRRFDQYVSGPMA